MSRQLKIGLFGGTFDPIHNGHLALARAARLRFHLDCIYFIPSGLPPHKQARGLSPFLHRYAMVTLACAHLSRAARGGDAFLPSLLEAAPDLSGRRRYYSVDTVARLRRQLDRRARVYFLLGADAFLTLPAWKNLRRLVRLCDFIVATRPGFHLAEARRVLPPDLLAPTARSSAGEIRLRQSTIHLLTGVHADISSSCIRQLVRTGRAAWRKWVPPSVADYIEHLQLYC